MTKIADFDHIAQLQTNPDRLRPPIIDLDIIDGSLTLDEGWAPYAQGSLTIAMPPPETLAELDPRLRPSVIIGVYSRSVTTAGIVTNNGTTGILLGIRALTVNYDDGTVDLELASDEARLQDGINVDAVPNADAMWSQDSLRAIVDRVLANQGLASLEPGTADTPFHVGLSNATNLVRNPSATVDAANFGAYGGAGGSTTSARVASGGVDGGAFFRSTQGTASTSVTSIRNDMHGPVAGKTYTASCWFRSNASRTVRLRVAYMTNSVYLDVFGPAVTVTANTWTRLTVTSTAPATPGTVIAVLPESPGPTPSGAQFDLDQVMVVESETLTDYFDGSTPDTVEYRYDWTGTAHASTSTRLALKDRDADALLWQPGQSAWDFLEPLVVSSGFRLFCDEFRYWRLVDASYTLPGRIAVAASVNATSASETISRDDDTWFESVVIKYSWKDSAGIDAVQFDRAYLPGVGSRGKGLSLEYSTPYPGDGAAQYILSRAAGKGRTQGVKALSDYLTRPCMEVGITLPGVPETVSLVSSVSWGFASGEMDIKTRGL